MATDKTLIRMDRQEAQIFMRFIDKRRKAIVMADASVRRKHSWTDAQKAMARGELARELEVWADLHRRLGEAFDTGGY